MDFITSTNQEKPPLLQLLFIGFLAIAGLLVFAIIGFVIIYFAYGFDVLMNVASQKTNLNNSANAFKILLTAQQLGLFLTPALLLAVTESKKPNRFYGMAKPKITILLIVFWLMLFSLPFIGFVNELNQKMSLPSFLKELENWMRRLENEGMQTTMVILKMKNFGEFLINFLVVALVPAICEEFLFRGALQRTFYRIFKNPHIAIWVGAIIFSAIHFQFFGFFPRMLLGASLGYIYYYTGSIWYSVFAHLLNNGYAVILAFYMQLKNLPINNEEASMGWVACLISAILTLALFKILKEKTATQLQ
jgi:membrane protease YdiL (CAAX protease family)